MVRCARLYGPACWRRVLAIIVAMCVAHLAQGDEIGNEIQDCPQCPMLVDLPSGRFVMGDDDSDPSEAPSHEVLIAYRFAIGKHEVSIGEWSACLEAGACKYRFKKKVGNGSNFPMRNLSWDDAQDYVAWLSDVTGKTYRLPTEAEWEYAARAGTGTVYWWGDDVGDGNANCKKCGGAWNRKAPSEVASLAANPWGLHGVSGGVWEWVADCWTKNYEGAPADGSARQRAQCSLRVLRGGSWRNDRSYSRSRSRFKYDADVRYIVNGLRVVRELE